MNSTDYESQRTNTTPLIVTPFQIFCFQNRSNAMKLNPHLKGTAITSLLAKMWRSLDIVEKQRFEEWSRAIRTQHSDNFDSQKAPLYRSPEPKRPKLQIVETYTPLESLELPYPPKIFIRSSSNFGQLVSQISKDTVV
ncbi:HMG box family protein [Trichomonas vaginalis G3]|uniref:HMG box family protein n=1 Tax=Trichomonas vaginalis (strain ATCC PRA-98 / G3) TaxID=412133 RepID=A2E759_TRIV3|nr:HMG-box family [Trichomonas vaginalis G3]EAY11456.1 HMG box family protein [Trichomonas vaginalis G3]KAI5526779.1 HMG-box family [Trichomonas vaginalis G3]|eukprot:XP_001323679.1 HMG box family protein [Trichomonas vaginalis G3]